MRLAIKIKVDEIFIFPEEWLKENNMTSRFVNYSKIFYANFETTDILGEYFFKRTFM